MKCVLKNRVGVPRVTLQQIINYCGRKTYELGREYLHSEALYVRYQERQVIKALCAGITNSSYTLKITFDANGITSSACTCHENAHGPCKHLAALLITWYYQPESFPKRAELPNQLMETPKEDLIMLIQKIIDLYPETNRTGLPAITAIG
jgi:uncharacterized Zn finger protein